MSVGLASFFSSLSPHPQGPLSSVSLSELRSSCLLSLSYGWE